MIPTLHRAAGGIAFLTILVFFTSTVIVELVGDVDAIVATKQRIVTPGLYVLIPAIAVTGITGFLRGRARSGRLVEAKRRRMPFIAANGLLILVPAALTLSHWAAQGRFDTAFYAVQALELIAGAVNLTLMGWNIRDGRYLAGRWRRERA